MLLAGGDPRHRKRDSAINWAPHAFRVYQRRKPCWRQMHMKKVSVIRATVSGSSSAVRGAYIASSIPKTKVCLCPWTRRKQFSLLVHPVRWRPSSNSRRIGRPATPSGMSAS